MVKRSIPTPTAVPLGCIQNSYPLYHRLWSAEGATGLETEIFTQNFVILRMLFLTNPRGSRRLYIFFGGGCNLQWQGVSHSPFQLKLGQLVVLKDLCALWL